MFHRCKRINSEREEEWNTDFYKWTCFLVWHKSEKWFRSSARYDELSGNEPEENLNSLNPFRSTHHLLEHANDAIIWATALKLDIKNIFSENICKSYVISKIRKENIKKYLTHKATKIGERIYFDSSSIGNPSAGGSKF